MEPSDWPYGPSNPLVFPGGDKDTSTEPGDSQRFPKDYIYNFYLAGEDGANVALYNYYTTWTKDKKWSGSPNFGEWVYFGVPTVHWGRELDTKTEDLWLFSIYTWDTDWMEFKIGPFRFIYDYYHFQFFKEMRDWKCNLNWGGNWSWQYIAVRTPKLDNPTVTIKAPNKGFMGVSSVGLFLKQNAIKQHEFITIATTAALNPEYAKRHQNASWYSPDSPIDVCGRAFSMQPKALLTANNDNDLYARLTTPQPGSKYSAAHIDYPWKWYSAAHMWFSAKETLLVCWDKRSVNYCTRVTNSRKKDAGWAILLEIFTDAVGIMGALATGQYGSVFGKVWDAIDKHTQEQIPLLAKTKGLIEAASTAFKKANEKKDGDFPEYKVNVKTIQEMESQQTFTGADFGDTT